MMLQRGSPSILDSQTDLSLSFCDLPISETREALREIQFERRPTSPNETEFEFFGSFDDLGVRMCSADDIFSHGRLLPYRSPTSKNTTAEGELWNSLKKDFFQAKGRALKHNYSVVDYQRLGKLNPKTSQTQKPKRVLGDVSGQRSSRPKWYLLMFGSMKAPVEMEMGDIRTRQKRRNPARMVPGVAGDVGEGKTRWKLLRALSCRGHQNAVVGEPSELRDTRVRGV